MQKWKKNDGDTSANAPGRGKNNIKKPSKNRSEKRSRKRSPFPAPARSFGQQGPERILAVGNLDNKIVINKIIYIYTYYVNIYNI